MTKQFREKPLFGRYPIFSTMYGLIYHRFTWNEALWHVSIFRTAFQ